MMPVNCAKNDETTIKVGTATNEIHAIQTVKQVDGGQFFPFKVLRKSNGKEFCTPLKLVIFTFER